jgi:hypothetical protein
MVDPVTISMLVSAGVSAVQAYDSYADQKEAQKAAQRLGAQLRATQEADKVSGLQVPTLGAELARQSLGQQMAMTVNALTGAGAAGVLGGIPGASAMGANAALEIAADLQNQQAARDQFVAAAQQDIEDRRVKAERDMIGDQLVGAQLQATASGNQMNKSIEGTLGALGQAGAAYVKAKPLYEPTTKATAQDYKMISGKQLEKQAIPVISPDVDPAGIDFSASKARSDEYFAKKKQGNFTPYHPVLNPMGFGAINNQENFTPYHPVLNPIRFDGLGM